MQRHSLAHIQFSTADDTERHWETAASAGFNGIELAVGDSTVGEADSALARLVPRWAKECPMCALALSVRTNDPMEAAAQVNASLPLAANRGVTHLNMNLLSIGGGGAGSVEYTEAVNVLHALLQQIRASAESTGVAVGLETGRDFLNSPVELRELIDDANTWAIGACVDMTKWPSADTSNDWLRTLHRRVTCVRVHRSRHDSATAVLDEIRFDGPVVMRA